MMKFAVAYDGPIALRYPRGAAYDGLKEIRQLIELAKSELIRKGSTVAYHGTRQYGKDCR